MLGVVAVLLYGALRQDDGFVPLALPMAEADRLFDVGVVDANGDGVMDIYTSNHHFRQVLWLGDGKGGFRDVLSEWGLDQSRDFPNAELNFQIPQPDKPGVYVYWRGTQLVIQTHRSSELGAWQGQLRVLDPVRIAASQGFSVNKSDIDAGKVTGTALTFAAGVDAKLVLIPGGQGLPLEFNFSGDITPAQIFVGLGRVSPQRTDFTLAMQDRHGHAWADINGDGVLDVFISRGALAGTLLKLPPAVASGIRDEMLVSEGPGRFRDETVAMGIEKKGCSGRHVSWVDVDGDGKLELFVNCYDREAVEGDFPKQLYRQVGPNTLREVAAEFGLGLPNQQIGSYAWVDVDGDGDADLLAFQDEGLFLYRNQDGSFLQEPIKAFDSSGAEKIGHTNESTWFYDGKIQVTDFDNDGRPDAFVASKRGNWLLRNEGGRFVAVDPSTVGLPARSMTAAWVDVDNDGLVDLHLVPQGVYRQRADHRFEPTGQLELDDKQFRSAIVNWLDIDNDGRMDVVFAANPDPEHKRWWHLSKLPAHHTTFQLFGYRQTASTGRWLEVDLDGPDGNRQGIGATVSVLAGGVQQSRIVGAADGSFFSQGHYRVHFGLGDHAKAERVRVQWTDGVVQDLGLVDAGQVLKVRRR